MIRSLPFGWLKNTNRLQWINHVLSCNNCSVPVLVWSQKWYTPIKLTRNNVYCKTLQGLGVGWRVKMVVKDGRAGEKYSKLCNREGQVLTMALILGMTGEKYSISIWLEWIQTHCLDFIFKFHDILQFFMTLDLAVTFQSF